MLDIIQQLKALGFIVNTVNPNKYNRVPTIHKPTRKNGWFKVHDNSVSYGSFDGLIEDGYFFLDNQNYIKPDEKALAEIRRQQALVREQRIYETQASYKFITQFSDGHTNHPYLSKKQVKWRDDFKVSLAGDLIIPILNIDNILTGYQKISETGTKMFKTGSIITGGFYIFKPESVDIIDLDMLFIAEGVATGGSIYQCLNDVLDSVLYGVICTFSAGNIPSVIDSLKSKFKKTIIGVADNDHAGIKYYTGTGVKFCVPGLEDKQDANDVYVQYGPAKLSQIITDFMKTL